METKKTPTVSIIVPIHNVDHYLYNCLESIKKQTFKDFEVLLINDGSNDGSERICCDFCGIDKRFNLINQRQKGVSEARNTGLKLCKGKYISMIDGDDYIHPKMIEVLYNALNDGDYDFSMIKGTKVYNYSSKFSTNNIINRIVDLNMLLKELYNSDFESMQFKVVWNKLFKKELIYNELMKSITAEDCEFNNRIYLKTKNAILIDNVFYYWVQRNNSITHTHNIMREINEIDTFYICLNEIPILNKKCRAYCLMKLFKSILSIRYFCGIDIYEEIAHKKTRDIYNLIKKEFLSNKHIPIYIKIIFFMFYYLPFTYSIFVSMYGLLKKIKND